MTEDFSLPAGRGVVLEYGDYVIETTPVTSEGKPAHPSKGQLSDSAANAVEYPEVFGKDSILRYTPQFDGYKEDIILTSDVGTNRFSFLVRTNGLALQEYEGAYIFADPATGEQVSRIGDLIIDDAAGLDKWLDLSYQHRYELETVRENEEYVLTAVVDERFMSEAVFPVVVDPTITTATIPLGSGSSKTIQDAPIYSGQSGSSFGSNTLLHVGYSPTPNYGQGRALMRFANLPTAFVTMRDNIVDFNLHLYLDSGTANVNTEVYYGLNSSWTESNAKYSENSGLGGIITWEKVSGAGYKKFRLAGALEKWRSTSELNKGIVIKSSDEYAAAKVFYSTEYATTSKRPYLSYGYIPSNTMSTIPYGAPTYDQIETEEDGGYNCVGFALQVYDFIGGDDLELAPDDTVEDTARRIIDYFQRKQPGRTIRRILGVNGNINYPLADDEYRAALRCTGSGNGKGHGNRYHMLIQTNDGNWASKHETYASEGASDPRFWWTYPATPEGGQEGNPPFITYESNIIYFAIEKPSSWV